FSCANVAKLIPVNNAANVNTFFIFYNLIKILFPTPYRSVCIRIDSKKKLTSHTEPLNSVNTKMNVYKKNKDFKISHFEKTEKNIFGKPKTSAICAMSNKDTARPAGGIGRRVRLKHQYLRMCRFDSGAGYF